MDTSKTLNPSTSIIKQRPRALARNWHPGVVLQLPCCPNTCARGREQGKAGCRGLMVSQNLHQDWDLGLLGSGMSCPLIPISHQRGQWLRTPWTQCKGQVLFCSCLLPALPWSQGEVSVFKVGQTRMAGARLGCFAY